jgi:hypothetical protein
MPYTQLANLDFNEIKQSLKDYLRSQSDFTDYDFEGSVLSNLLDVLAYNTYYTAFNTNMVVNELFIDSATLRDNVVAIAKQLGYRPKSVTSPTAYITFTVTYNNPTTDTILVLKRGSGFITSYDNVIYQYVVSDDVKAQVSNGVATFTDVALREGSELTSTFTVDTNLKSQKFVLDNGNIDTNSIRVKVFPTGGSFSEPYLVSENILGVDKNSKVFFINEIEDERYELVFGDGVLGKKLENNTIIEVSYLVTSGPASNGVRTFVYSGVLETQDGADPATVAINILSVVASAGGEELETTKKIKYNAPKSYGTQDRAVTSQDYEAIVRNVYPSTSDVIIFGGEDQVPPEYGKVFIVLKPKDASYVTSLTKTQIINQLKKYVVASVQPVIVDPSILYIELNSKIYYDSTITSANTNEIRDKVITSLQQYIELSDIEKFNGKFRHSKIVGAIDDSDRSINSNITSVTMRKDFYPQLNSSFYYEICFQNAFDKDCEDPILSSTPFRVTEYPNWNVYMEDRDGKIILYRLEATTGQKIVVDNEIGKIDYDNGELIIYSLTIIKGSFFDNRISVKVKPLVNDIQAFREVYLDIDVANSSFIAYKE